MTRMRRVTTHVSRSSHSSEHALDQYGGETMFMKLSTWLAVLLSLTLLLTACGIPASASPIGMEAVVPAEPAVQSGAAGPDLFALTEWDVVWISDNTGYYAAREYAKLIEEEFGVTVRLHDVVVRDLTARQVLAALRGDSTVRQSRLKQLPELVRHAEVVVLSANPLESDTPTASCSAYPYFVTNGSRQTWDQYRDELDRVYQTILGLRGNAPIAIRAYDAYNFGFFDWNRYGVKDACFQWWEAFNQTIHEAAEEHSIPVAEVYAAYNGPDHTEDPRNRELLGWDRINPNAAGARMIAELVHDLGYEPTVQ